MFVGCLAVTVYEEARPPAFARLKRATDTARFPPPGAIAVIVGAAGLPVGVTGREAAENGLVVPPITAATRKRYGVPFTRPEETVWDGDAETGSGSDLAQVEPLSSETCSS